jgi:hypothetical protein
MFQTTGKAQKLLSQTLQELRARSSRLYSRVEIQTFRRNISLPSSELKSKPCKKTGVSDKIIITRSWIWCSHCRAELGLSPASADFFLGLLFDLEDRGNMFLRNVGPFPNYTVVQPAVRTSAPTSGGCVQFISLRLILWFLV